MEVGIWRWGLGGTLLGLGRRWRLIMIREFLSVFFWMIGFDESSPSFWLFALMSNLCHCLFTL